MTPAEKVFWIGVFKPIVYAVLVFFLAVLAWCFRRYMPDGPIKRYFLITRPEAKRRRRMRAEARKRERDLAAYDRGTYLGKRAREFFSPRDRG